jgi:hypothetical protein
VVSGGIAAPNPGAVAALRFQRLQRLLLLSLEEFGASTLEAEAERYSVTPAELGRHAVRYYLADRGSGRMALRVPRLSGGAAREPALELKLDLDSDSWNELEGEAERQGVSLERLLEHAVVYFLADLDAGRVERRMLEDESA